MNPVGLNERLSYYDLPSTQPPTPVSCSPLQTKENEATRQHNKYRDKSHSAELLKSK